MRLVEVTSNIWGTKFKIHGLVNSVPANLGQVTYKTSLLHLQPRQMTLVMTELRDDFPTGPDPTFNPNLFSEDEEDLNQLEERAKLHKASIDNSPPIAPMSPRSTRLARPKSQISNHFITPEPTISTNVGTAPALAKAESYEDEVVFHIGDVVSYCEGIRPQCSYGHIANQSAGRATNSIQSTSFMGQYNRTNSNNSGNQRHAISPLCCEGSVPALQSPKNAVAPSDIIFDRPPAQTLLSYSTADYTSTSNNVQQVKSNIMSDHGRNGISLSLNLNADQRKPIVVKKDLIDSSSKMCAKTSGESDAFNIRPINFRNSHETVANSNKKRELVNKSSANANCKNGTSDKLKYIDEENNEDAIPGPSKPVASTSYLTDSMIRSCSVGYLDLVDAQLVPSDVTLQMLRKDAPKRLVLVNQKTKQKKHHKKLGQDNKSNSKSSRLKNCGKSKSLDSSDIFPPYEMQNFRNLTSQIREAIPEVENQSSCDDKNSSSSSPSNNNTHEALTLPNNNSNNNNNNKNKRDNSRLNFFVAKSPLIKRKKSESSSNTPLNSSTEKLSKSRSRTKQKTPIPQKKEQISSNDTNAKLNSTPLHTHALTTLENLITRLRDDNRTTPPSSPRLPRSSPSSPAPTKKGEYFFYLYKLL